MICDSDLNHPKAQKVAMFDIITPDLETGPAAATGELVTLVNDCLGRFPLLSQNYDIHISHSASQYFPVMPAITSHFHFQSSMRH